MALLLRKRKGIDVMVNERAGKNPVKEDLLERLKIIYIAVPWRQTDAKTPFGDNTYHGGVYGDNKQ
jgi:hypothetical protein